MAPAVLAVKEPGDRAGWLLTELKKRVVVIDRRRRYPRSCRTDEGLLIAPFCTEDAVIEHLDKIDKGWRRYIAIIRPGAERVESLLADPVAG